MAAFIDRSVLKDANLSGCGKYRYWLRRSWDSTFTLPTVTFIMLNPSTADAEQDDPTIRRCISFAKAWGCGQLAVVNLFAFRATDPKELATADDPVGIWNHSSVTNWTYRSQIVVAAWGVHGKLNEQGAKMERSLRQLRVPLRCLGVTKDGYPRHPLYVKSSATLIPYGKEF